MQHNNVEERKRYWDEVVHSEIPVGSSYADVKHWAASRQLTIAEGQSAASLVAGLEYVPVNSVVCKGFGLSLWLTLDSELRNVTQETVKTAGSCL